MNERLSSCPEEEHGVGLVRLAAEVSIKDGLEHLKKVFSGLEVSIYRLPAQNNFNFALIGAFTQSVMSSKIEMEAEERPDYFESFWTNPLAARRVFHGTSLTPYSPDIAELVLKTKVPDNGVPRLYGMLFLEKGINDLKVLGKVRSKLKETLSKARLNTSYCLSAIEKKGWEYKDEDEMRGRRLFTSSPLAECNCWIRVSVDLSQVGNTIDALDRMDHFYDLFSRSEVVGPTTTAFYPALLEHATDEIASREAVSRNALKEKFPTNVAKTFWFGFGTDGASRSGVDSAKADLEFPMTNYVISASSGTGKTNAALAILNAFVRWQLGSDEKLEHSPDFEKFDALYINMKAQSSNQEVGQPVKEKNEARLLKAFAQKNDLKVDCVRATDLKEFFLKGHVGDHPTIVYSEPDGATFWQSTIDAISSPSARSPRGLLLIVDEAFKPSLNAVERADLHGLYGSILKTWRSRGVRMVLIGQEMTGDQGVLSYFGQESVDLASLVIGCQENSEELETLLLKGFEKDESIIDWLETKGSGRVFELAERIKPSFRKVGPVVVRATLFGTKCLPIPCHVRPTDLTGIDLSKLDVTWWKPEA